MKTVIVTGRAGFMEANLREHLLKHKFRVVCPDNFSTCHECNVAPFLSNPDFISIGGDTRFIEDCREAVRSKSYVFTKRFYSMHSVAGEALKSIMRQRHLFLITYSFPNFGDQRW